MLDKLKSTPASQYDVGKLDLELSALVFTRDFYGKPVDSGRYVFWKFDVEETAQSLALRVFLSGPAENVTIGDCSRLRGPMEERFPRISEAIRKRGVGWHV